MSVTYININIRYNKINKFLILLTLYKFIYSWRNKRESNKQYMYINDSLNIEHFNKKNQSIEIKMNWQNKSYNGEKHTRNQLTYINKSFFIHYFIPDWVWPGPNKAETSDLCLLQANSTGKIKP